MSDSFEDYQERTHPPGHRGRWGAAWGRAWGRQKDKTVTRARDAVLASFPSRAPADALEHHLADAALERLPGETDASVRVRVSGAFDLWATAGTRGALELAISQLGLTGTLYTPADLLPDDPPRPGWAQWWFMCTGHPWGSDGIWSDPGIWDDGGVWDLDATPAEMGQVRRLLRAWTNARDRGHVVFVFEEDWWGPETPWDNGKWTADPAQSGPMVI